MSILKKYFFKSFGEKRLKKLTIFSLSSRKKVKDAKNPLKNFYVCDIIDVDKKIGAAFLESSAKGRLYDGN